jgi:glycosyltransferase involved in cell wall biosynthesis
LSAEINFAISSSPDQLVDTDFTMAAFLCKSHFLFSFSGLCCVFMDKIRVLLLITDLEIGGAPRVIQQLAVGLDRSRFEVETACLANDGPIARELRQQGIPTHCLQARGPWDVRVFSRLSRLIRRFRPDILQCALVHANVVGRIVGAARRVPHIVAAIHTIEKGTLWHLTLETLTCRLSDRTVCVSDAVARHIHQTCNTPQARLQVIPNGIDYDHFADAAPIDPAELGLNPRRRTLIYVGRLDRVKGVEILLAAMADLVEQFDLQLIVAGDGPEKPRLKSLADQKALLGRVHFLGFHRDVAGLLKASDMLILPSFWEGLPLSVMESMAAGTPVVASRIDGVSPLIQDHKTGLLFTSGDSQSLKNAISELLAHPELRGEIIPQAQKLVREKYTRQTMIRGYERLFDSLQS